MKKTQRALKAMILTLGFFLLIVGILWIFLFPLRSFTNPNKDTNMIAIAQDVSSLILAIIQLCIIGIAIYGLHRYFRYYRPSIFIFKGFSNASKLVDIDHVPIDLDNLAREELAYQFGLSMIIWAVLAQHRRICILKRHGPKIKTSGLCQI